MARSPKKRTATAVPYLKWRDGRPRWNPGPHLRAKGFKGRDLKDGAGQWLSRGAAIDAAIAINQAVNAEDKHALAAVLGGAENDRTMRALFARLKESRKFRGEQVTEQQRGGKTRKVRLAERTRREYVRHLILLEEWCGDVPVARLLPADVEDFHDQMCEARGAASANAILRTLKLALNYAVNKLRWIAVNPCVGVEMPALDGRLVLWEPEEINTFIAAAEWLGRDSAADAVVMALLTGQIRGDIITVPPLVLEHGVYRMQRRKTGRMCYIPPCELLTARLDLMRRRNAARWPATTFTTQLVNTETGTAYSPEGSGFTDEQRLVRAVAAGAVFAIEDCLRFMAGAPPRVRNLPFTPMPSLLDKRFADLRDTAVTYLYEATGGDIGQVVTITGHSLKTAHEIIDRHYYVRQAKLAIEAGQKYDALLARLKIGG